MEETFHKYAARIVLGEMLKDKEHLESEAHERLRLARRVARLWSWDYRPDTNTVLWTIPEAQSDRTVQVTLDICPLKQLQELQQVQRDATIAADIADSINNPLQVVVSALHLAEADIEGVSLKRVKAAIEAASKVADAVRELTRRLDRLPRK